MAGAILGVRCPLVVYNVPSRTAVSIDVDTLIEAANRAPNVVGLKDASGNVTYCQALLSRVGSRLSVLRLMPSASAWRRSLERPSEAGARRRSIRSDRLHQGPRRISAASGPPRRPLELGGID